MNAHWGDPPRTMKPKNMNTMNPAQIQEANFRSSFRLLCVGLIVSILAAVVSACSTGFSIGKALPFDIGIRYKLEENVYLVATPQDKGGMKVSLDVPEGEVSEWLKKDVNEAGETVWTVTSKKSGRVWRITERANGRPLIELVSGGDGRLQLIPADPQPAIPTAKPAPQA